MIDWFSKKVHLVYRLSENRQGTDETIGGVNQFLIVYKTVQDVLFGENIPGPPATENFAGYF